MGKSIALAVSTLIISGCGGDNVSETPIAPVGTASTTSTSIRFIELNDLHAHIVPHTEQVRSGDNILLSTRGGLARIKTKMLALSNENTIVMNIGDTFHGGAEALFSNGNDIVDLVNNLPIDIAVMGNWDFAYGGALTVARFGNGSDVNVTRPNFEYIAANTTYKVPNGIRYNPNLNATQKAIATSAVEKVFSYKVGDPFMNPTKMIERGGVKIGFIGITSDIVNRMSPLLAPFIAFTRGEAAYIALIEQYSDQLKAQGANMVVVMSELGIHKDVQLANNIKTNSVDVFFSAHTHEATFTMIESTSGAKVVESGDDTYLGEMNVVITEGKPSNYTWKLHEITGDITPDAQILAQVEATRSKYIGQNISVEVDRINPNTADANLTGPEARIAAILFSRDPAPITLNASLDTTIGTTTLALNRKNVLENGFNAVFAKLLKNSKNTMMGLVPGFRYDDAIIPTEASFTGVNPYNWTSEANIVLNGEITIENIYRFLPSTNYVATAAISGVNLKRFVENELTSAFSTDAFNQDGGWMPGFSGLNIHVDISQADGSRLIYIADVNGTPILDDDNISVASACARPFEPTPALARTTLCGKQFFSGVTQDKNTTTADFLIDAFTKNLDENLSDEKQIVDHSGQLFWPEAAYVQPVSQIDPALN